MRRCGSSSSIISIARTFGAPVLSHQEKLRAADRWRVTVLVLRRYGADQMMHGREGFHHEHSGTFTEPATATRPISLRIK